MLKRKIPTTPDYSCKQMLYFFFSYPTNACLILFPMPSFCKRKIMILCFCSLVVGADRFRGFYYQAEVSKYVSSLKQALFLD